MDMYNYTPIENVEDLQSPRPLTSPRDKVKRFINNIKKISPRATLKPEHHEHDFRHSLTAEQQQKEFVRQLRMTLKSDSIKPIQIPAEDSYRMSVKLPPPPPPSVTIEQVAERLDDLTQLLSYEGDFNISSAGIVVIMDAAASFVRVTRLYITSIEKKVDAEATAEQEKYYEDFKNFQAEIQEICLNESGNRVLDLDVVGQWKKFILANFKFPIKN
jgi:hypothetical protein